MTYNKGMTDRGAPHPTALFAGQHGSPAWRVLQAPSYLANFAALRHALKDAPAFDAATAARFGIPPAVLHHHRKQGRLWSVGRGLFRFEDQGLPTFEESIRIMASQLGPEAIASHATALALQQCTDLQLVEWDFLVPRERRYKKRPHIRLHTTQHALPARDLTIVHGVKTTSLVRSILDAVKVIDPYQIEVAVYEANARHILDVEQLRERMPSAGKSAMGYQKRASSARSLVMRYKDAAAFRMALDRRIIDDAGGNQLRTVWYRKRIAFDRILARLEIVAPGEFVLKGGLALHYRFGDHARNTYDMDFAVQNIARMREVMHKLVNIELGDFFSLSVGKEPETALVFDQGVTAYRWSLETRLNDKTFERSVIDVGIGDVILPEYVSCIKTQPILTFADIEPTEIHVISLEQHVAEKIHAYVQYRGGRENTRIKDLIDLCLLSRMNLDISPDAARRALHLTFVTRDTSIPTTFPFPPESWHSRYSSVARGVDVPATLTQAWEEARLLVLPIIERTFPSEGTLFLISKAPGMARKKPKQALPPTELRIPRPYGGAMVLRAEKPATALEAFFADAQEWFADPPALSLFSTSIDIAERQSLERAAFTTHARDWDLPVRITVEYDSLDNDAGRLVDVPEVTKASSSQTKTTLPAVRGERYSLPATIGRRAIAFAIAGAQELGNRWGDDPAKLVVFMRDGVATAEVTLVPLSAVKDRVTEADRNQLREALQCWKEIDQDVLDILVTNVLNGTDRFGRTYISYDTILDARERVKKSKVEDGKRYAAGHRAKDRDEIHRSILRLHNLGAVVSQSERDQQRGRRGHAPVILMHVLESDQLTNAPLGVWYSLGSWAETATDDVLVSRKILSYDPYRQSVEKRLGRLLTIILAEREHAECSVSDLISEICLSVEGQNRNRAIQRFEKAISNLTS